SMLVALLPQHPRDALRVEHTRRGPGAVVDLPQVFRRAPGRPAVGEGHPIDRLLALRENPAHERATTVDGRKLVPQPEVAHALPSCRCLDLRVQRLRLSHTWSTGNDDEVRGLEARRLEVELLEAGRDAGDVLFSLVQALDVLERISQNFADGKRAAFQAPLGEAEDYPLGVVHQRLDVVLGVERLRDDLARRLDELAQDGAVADDRCVRAKICGDGALLDEQGERGGPAHELELIAAPEL